MYNLFVPRKKAAPASVESANARSANAYHFCCLYSFLQLTGPGRHEVVQRVVGEYVEERDDRTAALNQPSAEVYICNVAELISLFFAELGYEYSRPQCLHTKGY